MTILYYDCFSGISGDMNLGAMIDLGVNSEWLKAELAKLNLPGWDMKVSTDQRHGITGTRVNVIQTIHEHIHRNLSDIDRIISTSNLQKEVKKLALKIFTVIAEAEAHVHNVPVEKIHFHEVGAIDAIVDIVGAAICFQYFNPDAVIISPVELGGGMVKCAHGTLPVPAPATVEIVRNLKVKYNGVDFESTTPTGAAIISVLAEKSTATTTPLTIKKTGYGIGHREHPDIPNILRVSLAETDERAVAGHEAFLIECNIDDMNPELYDHVADKLYSAGAADVFLTTIMMKKGRPGITLSVICEKGAESKIYDTIFTETTTIGLRTTSFLKNTLVRRQETISTEFGEIRFKLSFLGSKLVSSKPEAEDCRAAAGKYGVPLKEIYARLGNYCLDNKIKDQ